MKPTTMLSAATLPIVAAMAMSWASPAATATLVRKGTIKVVATITLTPAVPASAALTGTVYISAGAGSNSASAPIARTGSTAVVTILVPYIWTLDSSQTGVGVSFSISTNLASNPSASATIAIPLPADGATTEVRLPLAI